METDIAGNFKNYEPKFLDWVREDRVDDHGIRFSTPDDRPFTPDIRLPAAYIQRTWTNSTDRKEMTQNRPHYHVLQPGNSIYTDLSRLRKENSVLKRKLFTAEGQDALLMEKKRQLERKRIALERRERELNRLFARRS